MLATVIAGSILGVLAWIYPRTETKVDDKAYTILQKLFITLGLIKVGAKDDDKNQK